MVIGKLLFLMKLYIGIWVCSHFSYLEKVSTPTHICSSQSKCEMSVIFGMLLRDYRLYSPMFLIPEIAVVKTIFQDLKYPDVNINY